MVTSSRELQLYKSKIGKANLAICQSCYWIASCFKADYKDFPRCPRCGRDIVNILPISDLTFFKNKASNDEGMGWLLEEIEI